MCAICITSIVCIIVVVVLAVVEIAIAQRPVVFVICTHLRCAFEPIQVNMSSDTHTHDAATRETKRKKGKMTMRLKTQMLYINEGTIFFG